MTTVMAVADILSARCVLGTLQTAEGLKAFSSPKKCIIQVPKSSFQVAPD